ncbi:MAG: hypothetical protein JW726_06590 [Anaerolineales bacterium]|nr:hypothetical protein [Anaerolineales bacterium]
MQRRISLLIVPILSALLVVCLVHILAKNSHNALAAQPPPDSIDIIFTNLAQLDGSQISAFSLQPPSLAWTQLVALAETWQPPETIRVGLTGNPLVCNPYVTYTVQIVDFEEYVKDVLPNEWDPGWRVDSYRAGAMAVKMYAWYWIERGGKWHRDWGDADVLDSTCDQVYRPGWRRTSTTAAVEHTWRWKLTNTDGATFATTYRHDESGCTTGTCLSQVGSQQMAVNGATWDQILLYYYSARNPVLAYADHDPAGFALRFYGTPDPYGQNRLLIPLDDAGNTLSGPPVDVGATDFTIEFWLNTDPVDLITSTHPISCGMGQDWMYGNILLDRTISSQALSGILQSATGYGISLDRGRILFGVNSQTLTDSLTLCSSESIPGSGWHHVALQRRVADGAMWIYIDGQLSASGDGPNGDLSYPDTLTPALETDPFLSVGAWKQDENFLLHPLYDGWLDELRFSTILRYTTPFTPAKKAFITDTFTVALFHFDEGLGLNIHDSSAAIGGPSNGAIYYGGNPDIAYGNPNTPEWLPSTLFATYDFRYTLPLIFRNLP